MKSGVCFRIFLMSLFALGANPAAARTLDVTPLPMVGGPGQAVGTATNFDLVLRAKAVPPNAEDWLADEKVALSGGVLGKSFNVRTVSNFAATARETAQARVGALNAADDADGLPIIPQKDGGVISSLTGALGLDWPITDDDNQTITGTVESVTSGTGTEDIPELHWDFWLTPGAARPNPWPILEPLMAEGTVFLGLLTAVIAAWAISRHRQLQEP
jgi:hypothetical protein